MFLTWTRKSSGYSPFGFVVELAHGNFVSSTICSSIHADRRETYSGAERRTGRWPASRHRYSNVLPQFIQAQDSGVQTEAMVPYRTFVSWKKSTVCVPSQWLTLTPAGFLTQD